MIKVKIFYLSLFIISINVSIFADEGNALSLKCSSSNASEVESLLRNLDKKKRLELVIAFLTCALQRSGQ